MAWNGADVTELFALQIDFFNQFLLRPILTCWIYQATGMQPCASCEASFCWFVLVKYAENSLKTRLSCQVHIRYLGPVFPQQINLP